MKVSIKFLAVMTAALVLTSQLTWAQDMPPQPDGGATYSAPAEQIPHQPVQAQNDNATATAQGVAKNIALASLPVSLPTIENYREIYGKYPNLDDLMRQFTPSGNLLQAFYLQEDDLANWQAHPQQGFHRYIMVQSLVKDITMPDAAAFETVKEQVKKSVAPSGLANTEGQKVLDKAAGYLRENYDSSAQLKIGQTRVVGMPVDNGNTLSVLILANYAMQSVQGTKGFPMVISLNVYNIKGHALFVFIYNFYKSGADVDGVNAVATTFRQRLFALNGMQDIPVAQQSYNGVQPLTAADPIAVLKGAAGSTDEGVFHWLNIAIIGVAALMLLIILAVVFGSKGRLRDIILGKKDDVV